MNNTPKVDRKRVVCRTPMPKMQQNKQTKHKKHQPPTTNSMSKKRKACRKKHPTNKPHAKKHTNSNHQLRGAALRQLPAPRGAAAGLRGPRRAAAAGPRSLRGEGASKPGGGGGGKGGSVFLGFHGDFLGISGVLWVSSAFFGVSWGFFGEFMGISCLFPGGLVGFPCMFLGSESYSHFPKKTTPRDFGE